jgi:hypothetical protein
MPAHCALDAPLPHPEGCDAAVPRWAARGHRAAHGTVLTSREAYRAAALPYCNRQRATSALRGQLRLVAGADDVVPDWTTLFIDGPTTSAGRHGATCYEWSATVRADTPDDHQSGDAAPK